MLTCGFQSGVRLVPYLQRPNGWRRRRWVSCSAERPLDSLEQKMKREQRDVTARTPPVQSIGRVGVAEGVRDVGTFWLCCANAVVFLLDHVGRVGWVQNLYLYHAAPHWWQFLTSAFCHANWEHLSSNIFLCYVFGKLVEEQEGAFGVWAAYLICALGGNLASYWLYPPSAVSLGASAAMFGLFVVSILVRISWNLKNLLEVGILGQFVVKQVMNEVNMQIQGGSMTSAGQVGHLAHLGGALMGVLLILFLRQLPDPDAQ